MTKDDKHMGRVKLKHRQMPEPQRMLPAKRRKKEPPRYAAQRWWKGWLGFQGGWHDIGSSRSLDEAIRLMDKRDHWWDTNAAVRVVDRETGEVLRSRGPTNHGE